MRRRQLSTRAQLCGYHWHSEANLRVCLATYRQTCSSAHTNLKATRRYSALGTINTDDGLRLRLPFSHPPYKLLPGLAAVHRYSDVVVHRCTCCTDAVLRSRGAVSVQHRGCQCLASV